ncbi:Toll-interacting protein [Lamellibrachia satsuma]|nr:Toll-interacting protein [Lamellibrachia satsuma]
MAHQVGDRRQQVMLGDLPQDFLRVPSTPQGQQLMNTVQPTTYSFSQVNQTKLTVTVVQAKLAKNYGFTKMDPYCRLRIAHSVFETPTAHNGAKSPNWNKTLNCYVAEGVDSIYVEIFDERAFTMDERVAWTHVQIPESVFSGETSDDWYLLNGQQGDAREGMINLVISYSKVPVQQMVVPQPMMYTTGQPSMVMAPPAMPVYYQQPGVPGGYVMPPSQPAGPRFTEEDVKQIQEMFPDTDTDVVRSLLETNMGNKDMTINNLLAMQT